MYGLRDEAKKRGTAINWDADTGTVTLGNQSYTPGMLQGLGAQNIGGSWKVPEQALSAMFGNSGNSNNSNNSQQSGSSAYQQNKPPEYTPYEFQQYSAPAPQYDSILQQSLGQYMQEQPRLTQKAVDAVDTNTAARGMYRSGVRDSLATQAATDLESSLRQLAQQQAQGLYGQQVSQYQSNQAAHNQMQQALANQHNAGIEYANKNYWGAQDQRMAEQDRLTQAASEAWKRQFAEREFEESLRQFNVSQAAAAAARSYGSGGSAQPASTEPEKLGPEAYQALTEGLKEAKGFNVPAKLNAFIDEQIASAQLGGRTGVFGAKEVEILVQEFERLRKPVTQGIKSNPKALGGLDVGSHSIYDPVSGRYVMA